MAEKFVRYKNGFCVILQDKLAIEKMVGTLNLSIHQRDLRQNDPKQLVYTVMNNWLPLSNAILGKYFI